MAHDVRSNQRPVSQAWRIVLAVRGGDLDAAWEVLNELYDHPARLRELAVTLAAIAANRSTDAETLTAAGLTVDAMHRTPPGYWYPGDPTDDPTRPPPRKRSDTEGDTQDGVQ